MTDTAFSATPEGLPHHPAPLQLEEDLVCYSPCRLLMTTARYTDCLPDRPGSNSCCCGLCCWSFHCSCACASCAYRLPYIAAPDALRALHQI